MLAMDDFSRTFPVNTRTDRDGEAVILLEYLKSKAPFESLLDIGAFKSSTYYADVVRGLTKRYDAIDILHDPVVEGIVDNYYQADANKHKFTETYEAVICVSTIEHAGSQTYKADPKTEQLALFKRCLSLSRKHLWISFPVGLPYVFPDQLSIITEDILSGWENLVKDFKVTQRFLYTQGAQAGHPWHEHTNRSVATKIPYIDFIGNQSICVLEVEK